MAKSQILTPPGRGAATGRVDHAAEMARLDRLARLMDSRYSILGIRFGLDGLLGLVPVVGDTLSLGPAAYLLWKAHQLGVPRATLARMLLNSGADYVVGLVPLLGDVFDVAFKANNRNAGLLRAHLEKLAAEEARPIGGAGTR
ncbi:DUF4112 domain-containing protein [Pseudoroseicyclus aestuarii]|uniref:Uncharacterized protein DUF4112 n=1 Tax=Pseudoroseicyclus aestuarii TaxID=1795041 RepID=A0A318SNX9_9RHOB|nr:DUF4112 domain-containing protein [Pseudoroseicyclus aestuarii]PYE81285.1 uncharacterized protein DUF4112 [Pseudoroseicyclus aestuarii]